MADDKKAKIEIGAKNKSEVDGISANKGSSVSINADDSKVKDVAAGATRPQERQSRWVKYGMPTIVAAVLGALVAGLLNFYLERKTEHGSAADAGTSKAAR